MDIRQLALVPGLLVATIAFGQSPTPRAHADLINAQGQNIGTAMIMHVADGVKIDVNVGKLPREHTHFTFTQSPDAKVLTSNPPVDISILRESNTARKIQMVRTQGTCRILK